MRLKGCYFCSLETGGYWMGIVFLGLSFLSFPYVMDQQFVECIPKGCNSAMAMRVAAIFTSFFAVAIASFFLIRGVQSHSHSNVLPFLIVWVIATFFTPIQMILVLTRATSISTEMKAFLYVFILIISIILVYVSWFLYSLFVKIKEENESGSNSHLPICNSVPITHAPDEKD